MKESIEAAVCSKRGITHGMLHSGLSHSIITVSWAIVYYFLNEKLGWSAYRIAKDYEKSQSHVLDSIRKVDQWMIAEDFKAEIEAIRNSL